MKLTLFSLALLFTFSAPAIVNPKNCPDSFTISYHQIKKAPLNSDILASLSVKYGWDSLVEMPVLQRTFTISTRTNSHLCVYTTEGSPAAFFQTNSGVDEINVPYNYTTYFRTKVGSFSRHHIELLDDEASKEVYAPISEIDSDGGTNTYGEVKVGWADSVEITNVK